jgi:hypothetical protein
MTLDEIKAAVAAGKTVHWGNESYRVMVDNLGQWLIHRAANDWTVGLTHRDGVTLGGAEEEFFIAGAYEEYVEQCHHDGEIPCIDTDHHSWSFCDDAGGICRCNKCGVMEY